MSVFHNYFSSFESFIFFTGNYLLGNKGAHMYNGNAFICKECGKTYKTRRGLQNHSCLKCHSCIKTFSTKQLLERHKCKSNDTFRCEKCLTSYSSLQRLTTHKCKYCPQCHNICSSFQCRMSHKCSATNRDDHFKCVKDEVEDKTRTWNECEKETIPQYPKKQSKNTYKPLNKPPNASGNHNIQHETRHEHNEYHHKSRDEDVKFIKAENYQKTRNDVDKSMRGNTNSGSHGATVYKFLPIDLSWQMMKAGQLSLQIHSVVQGNKSSKNQQIGNPLELKRTIPDGNCFFRAISYIISGCEEKHVAVREAIVHHMLTLGCKLKSVLPANEEVKSYIQSSKNMQPRTWATHVEIFTTAHLLKTDIYIYTKCGNSFKWLKHSGKFLDTNLAVEKSAVYLQHTNGNHYDVVLSTSNNSREEATDKLDLQSNAINDQLLRELNRQIFLNSKTRNIPMSDVKTSSQGGIPENLGSGDFSFKVNDNLGLDKKLIQKQRRNKEKEKKAETA